MPTNAPPRSKFAFRVSLYRAGAEPDRQHRFLEASSERRERYFSKEMAGQTRERQKKGKKGRQ